jgi:Telomere length regulation protein
VSSYLDQSDRKSRLRGMRIAREFSVLLGHEISFEELDEDEKLKKERLLDESVSGGRSPSAFELLTVTEGGASSIGHGNDSSDDEIEGYDLPIENPEENVALTPYLRVCLELLLCSDSDKDAHDKVLSSLLSIPRVVATHPADAADVCGPLVKELLRLNNSYNTDQFESLRSDALQSLLVAYPLQAMPVMQGALEDESYSLGMRVYVISSLSKASSTLSNAPSREDPQTHNDQSTASTSSASTSSASTSIKRPLKLAAGKKKVTYSVNNFGPVGPIFFYPILRLLALSIARNASGDIEKSRRGQENKESSMQGIRDYQIKPDNFKESFIRNSLSAPELKLEKKVVPIAIEEEDGDGLHSMIPCEALLALAMFVKCSVNSVCQR